MIHTAEVKWIKIVTDIFDDEKILLIESLPEADSIIVIWFKLLCLAGKQNNSGVFTMNGKIPYTDKMLATIFRRKETTVQMALKTFEQFGMIEIIEGVITIPNWGKHQSTDMINDHRDYMRKYMADYRSKQKLLINSKTNSKTNVKLQEGEREEDKNKNIPPIVPQGDEQHQNSSSVRFDIFWKAYPKKIGKGAAEKAWKNIKPSEDLLNIMISAIEAQKKSKQWQENGGQYIPYPSTWLNQKRWEDEQGEITTQRDYEDSGDFLGR